MPKIELKRLIDYGHDTIINDKESAIVGTDTMHPIKIDNEMVWTESKSISSKVGNYNKLNGFISQQYADELLIGREQCFTGKNSFKLDKKCNSVLGYCVEYYSKYVVYGESYLYPYIDKAKRESKSDEINPSVLVRACMLKYKAMMVRSFGKSMSKIIKSMSITTLLQEKYQYFVSLVISLGTQTAKYVMSTLYADRPALDNVDPNLSIRHICGLADYITTDTILDVKVRNNIDDKCVRQVLGYHYLSTRRSDLNIKRVIVYDAVSNKSVVINITDKNCNRDVFGTISKDIVSYTSAKDDKKLKSHQMDRKKVLEKRRREREYFLNASTEEQSRILKEKRRKEFEKISQQYPIGSAVIHRNLNKRGGLGHGIIESYSDDLESVYVKFDNDDKCSAFPTKGTFERYLFLDTDNKDKEGD